MTLFVFHEDEDTGLHLLYIDTMRFIVLSQPQGAHGI